MRNNQSLQLTLDPAGHEAGSYPLATGLTKRWQIDDSIMGNSAPGDSGPSGLRG